MLRTSFCGIACRCSNEVWAGMKRFFRELVSWRDRKDMRARAGPKWLDPTGATVRPQLVHCWFGSNHIRFSMLNFVTEVVQLDRR